MRVRILSCVSLVDLFLVRYVGGKGDGRGWEGPLLRCDVSWCVVFCALVGGHLFSGSTVPTRDFSHMLCI